MNIFYLDPDPINCAKMHCDKHVVKMILEYAQLLSTAHRVLDDYQGDECYKKTHMNHPSAIWVRESIEHYAYVYKLLFACLGEYTCRYGRQHATAKKLWFLSTPPNNIPSKEFVEPPQCMPDHCKMSDAVSGYRRYYAIEKAYMAVWGHSEEPEWWAEALEEAA